MSGAIAMNARILTLEGVHNFRDFGGYPTRMGAVVKRGVLWRSAQQGEASPADLEVIQGLGIRSVIDLRGPSERQAKPCRRHADFSAEVLTYPHETAGLALHAEAANGTLNAEGARLAMGRLYQGIAYRENLVAMLRCYFSVLLRAEGPSLIHCVAGKDRTGFAVALVQHALGVEPAEIMEDYLLTNHAASLEARVASHGAQLQAKYPRIDQATLRVLLGVEPDYLEAAFAAIKGRHGSIETYLIEMIGIDPERTAALRGHYLQA